MNTYTVGDLNLTKYALLDWLGNHEQAYLDFQQYFGMSATTAEAITSSISLNEILDWISDHDQLYNDMIEYFKNYNPVNSTMNTVKDVINNITKE